MIAFRVYPGSDNWMAKEDKLYWDIRIFPHRRAMLRFWRRRSEETFDPKFSAIVLPRRCCIVAKDGSVVMKPFMGLVLFRKGMINAEVVSHEAVHMACEYLRRCKHSTRLGIENDDREERLAYAIGNCVRQMADFLWNEKIWK